MKSGDGITPCFCVFGRPSEYFDFSYYEIQIGGKAWTIDLTNAPLYSYCIQYDEKIAFAYVSWVPLGSEGIQILKALKASGNDFTCRIYATGEEYYETTADANPQIATDFGYVYGGLEKSGYLDANGDATEHTMTLLKTIDADASLPKVSVGTLAENISRPVTAPQSTTPENVLSQDYYYYLAGDVSPEISTYSHYRNTSKDKTLDGYTMIYYFTDFDNNIIEVDGQKTFTKTKSGLSIAPGETFDSDHVKITDRAHIKYFHAVVTQNHFTDGTQVDVPRPSYFNVHGDVSAMPQKISIEPSDKLLMDVGGTAQLTVSFKPSFADTKTTWKSSKESIATVDENGLVTAHAAGAVKITAEASNGKKATKQINVLNFVHALEIQGGDSLTSGASLALTAVVTDPVNPTNGKVKWSTSNKSVAAVSASGKVTAKKVSETTTVKVIATAADGSGVTAEKTITIHPAPEKIDILGSDGEPSSNMTLEMSIGQTVRLNTQVYPADANQAVTWSTSKADIVSVSADGALTANKAGKAVVTVKAENGKSAKITIQVIAEGEIGL
jgi:uncharacterized protein YjdB